MEFSKSELFQKFRNRRTQGVGPALCVFSYLQELQCHGFARESQLSVVNPVGRTVEGASCQQVGQPRYFKKKKKSCKIKEVSAACELRYQARWCFPLALF